MQPHYKHYTKEDIKVWNALFTKQMSLLPGRASEAYIKGIRNIGLRENQIPNFAEISQRLISTTGWGLTEVPNSVPKEVFFTLLANKRLPTTTWLRKKELLDYLEPDMFHDVFGHVPLLTNQTFCDFLQNLAVIALKHLDNPQAIELLGRIYWYTIEFGLILENGNLRIYGAGILSSYQESLYCLTNEPKHIPFDIHEILNTPYDPSRIQNKYFVIQNYAQLFASLPQIESAIEEKVGTSNSEQFLS